MPEGPEVSFISKYIHQHCHNQLLHSITILKGRYVNHGPPTLFHLFLLSCPLKLLKVLKKGKVTFLHFEHNWCIISKLGLTGWWYVDDDKPHWMGQRASPNLTFSFEHTQLHYTDTLSYGTLTFTQDPKVIHKELDQIAPEVDTISLATTLQRASLKKYQDKLIEDVIIDQHALMSGIGNYLKSEILYAAQIMPTRSIQSISKDDWKRILHHAKLIVRRMEKAINHKDISNYENQMAVYMKKTDPKGNPVLTRKSKTGRTTYYVSS